MEEKIRKIFSDDKENNFLKSKFHKIAITWVIVYIWGYAIGEFVGNLIRQICDIRYTKISLKKYYELEYQIILVRGYREIDSSK